MTPAFQIARDTANNIHSGFKEAKDQNAIGNILSEIVDRGDPEELQNSIGKILSKVSPERQGQALQFLQSSFDAVQKAKQEKTGRAAAQQGGYTYGAPPGVQTQQVKNQAPPKPVGGLSGQPVSADIAQKTADVLAQNREANADDLALAFDTAGVPRANSNSYIENRRRQDENKPGSEFAKIREKSVSDYVNDAFTQSEEAESLKYTIAETKKAINGDVTGPGWKALAKNNPYTQLLIGDTPDEATLIASNKTLLGSTKGLFGPKPTEREMFLLLNQMLPAIGRTKEANMASIGYIERINDLKVLKGEIVDELTDGGKKYVPDLDRKVYAKMKPTIEKLRDDLKQSVENLPPLDKKAKKEDKIEERPGFVKMKDPQGIERWVPQNIANQLGQ